MTGSISPTGIHDNFRHERGLFLAGFGRVGGCDEAGRGPLAGPVVASCVVLPRDCDHSVFIDSKRISHKKRCTLFQLLEKIDAEIGVGIVSAEDIDRLNILQASLLAMKKGMESLDRPPDFLLVDGKFTVHTEIQQEAMIKGESKSASIAAASIVAKVTRDKIMADYHELYPQYNFIQHKGYPTKAHKEAIIQFGPSPIHRMSFRGVTGHGR